MSSDSELRNKPLMTALIVGKLPGCGSTKLMSSVTKWRQPSDS